MRGFFKEGKLNDKFVEIEVPERSLPIIEIFSSQGMEEMDMQLRDMFGNMLPKKTKKRKVRIGEAYDYLIQEESKKLIDMDRVVSEAVDRVEQAGIIFLDEIDKIASRDQTHGPDVSREGVQRDILPIVEGTTVTTKYGMVKTDHVLFIAAGAFHMSKPSDLIPELQGRFPIRVELGALDEGRLLQDPDGAGERPYKAVQGAPRDGGHRPGFRARRHLGDRRHRPAHQRDDGEYRREEALYGHGEAPRRRLLRRAGDVREDRW